jgi:hypothetical protein
MVDRIAKLEAALRVNAALLVLAQRLIAAYIAPESDRAAIISELIRLLEGRRTSRQSGSRKWRWAKKRSRH